MTCSSIIVTFNRKIELSRCIKAVLTQTKKTDYIVVVDNASTDHTFDYVKKELELPFAKDSSYTIDQDNKDFEIYSCSKDDVKILYIRKEQNTGGAGGFYTGLRFSHINLMTDIYWMMDDDGYPSSECLEILTQNVIEHDYVMPVSIDIENHDKLSWFIKLKNGKKTDDYKTLINSWGNRLEWVVPFNGVLLTKKSIELAGYVNKDFFIWGDDYEHYYRYKKCGINPITILNAKFFHPSQTVSSYKMFFGLIRISYTPSKLRMLCMIRNWTYIYLHYNQKCRIPIKFLMYFWFFIFTRHLDFKGFWLYILSVKDGLTNNFTRHYKYL